ncbi:hypothetical protein P153DRAFT_171097 [Dothidotthia symphoricarpi CBS 119687]|uniref:Uncharacterized protein n=1 Tax=Dothidotthia symphoricarpi CBS 119687 TaxID=1392245 RepID=A0A6A6AP82_9PLEO|nr:uncharacterized protein P153DRAFT_171097 [Dothidotthia symphoricarpi CBS 119687]KAF2132744.1 hypothetical protein P153DRAFT_171097 [Dothidotthia symphoricarpi CBS 119687]
MPTIQKLAIPILGVELLYSKRLSTLTEEPAAPDPVASNDKTCEQEEEDMEQPPNAVVTGKAYEELVHMGASIGCKGSPGTGTMGMVVRMRGKSCAEADDFGLTNHHVVCGQETLRSSKTVGCGLHDTC